MAIIGLNSHEDLTKCEINQVGLIGSTIAQNHLSTISLGSHIWSLLIPIHKSNVYQVEVRSNICSNSLLYLLSKNSCLVIIGTSAHEKLKMFGQVGVSSTIA